MALDAQTLTTLAAGEPISAFSAALVAILTGAGLVALLAQRLRLPTIPAYLITGVVLGPSAINVMGRAEQVHGGSTGALDFVGDLAVVLLMFGIGLHLDLSTLRRGMAPMLVAAAFSTLLSTLLLWPAATLLGASATTALVLAMAGALSSTAVVLRLLQERRELHRQHGRVALAILLVQDMVVPAMLIVVPLLAPQSATDAALDTSPSSNMFVRAGLTVVAILGIVVLGRYALPLVLDFASKCGARSMEVLTILSLAFAMGAASITQLLGLSPALGAFLGGFLLSGTLFRHALAGQIGTLRDVALAIFFTVIGMRLDLAAAADHLPTILLGLAGLIVLKTIALTLSIWFVGSTLRIALTVALALAGGGEFALVIFNVAEDAGALPKTLTTTATTIIVLSMLLIAPSMAFARMIASKWRLAAVPPWGKRATALLDTHAHDDPNAHPLRHVIVAGFGLVGRAVSDRLINAGDRVTVIEMNMQTVQRQQRLGRAFVFGDVSDPAVLESAGLLEADALILTIPDEHAVAAACTTARALRPDLFIVARASYMSRGVLAKSLGANAVVVEEIVTAEAMEKIVEHELQVRAGEVPVTPAPSPQASAPHPTPPDSPSPQP